MEQVIYKIINLVNNKFYVGSTINQKVRFRQHRKLLRGNRHHCKHLQAAWNKYGEIKFLFAVVEEVPSERSLQEIEETYLMQHVGKDYCYNTGHSADAPWRNAPAYKTPNFGKAMSSGQKAKISVSLKEFYAEDYFNHPRVGKTHSEETKAKISATKLANPTAYWTGKERDEATKQKISTSQVGKSKAPRKYTPDGLAKAQENMRRNAKLQASAGIDDVIGKFPDEVRVKYDFSNAVYSGALVRITGVVCKDHGVFSQYAAQFRKGSGCPSCGAINRAASKKAQMLTAWSDAGKREKMLAARKKTVATPTDN